MKSYNHWKKTTTVFLVLILVLQIGYSSCNLVYASGEEGVVFGQEKEENYNPGAEKKVFIGIDNQHVYDGMEQSYAEGYLPLEEKDTLRLVVPFTVEGSLKEEKLTVTLDFGSEQESPFLKKNYRKDVMAQKYVFGEEEVTSYLYTVLIPLEEGRKAGQYPVKVRAEGREQQGKTVSLEYTVFARLSGKNTEDEKKEEGEPGSEQGEDEAQEPGGVPQTEEGTLPSGGESESGANAEEKPAHQPKFILENCSLDGEVVEAGSSNEVAVVFRNMSRETAVKNLKITVSQEGNSLAFERNSQYFEQVKAKESVTLKQKIQVQKNAEQGSIPLQFLLEYEDEKGTAYTSTEVYTVRIYQPAQITIANCTMPSSVYANDTVIPELQIINQGRAPVYNVRVSMEGSGLFQVQPYFGGTLESGNELQGSIRIFVGTRDMKSMEERLEGTKEEKYGDTEAHFLLEYEDAYGQTFSSQFSYTTQIQEPQILSLKAEEEKTETNQWWISIVILCGVLLIFGLVIQTIRLRQIRRQ